ncbi:MAG TPA: beta-N-acetylhexosaminidase [Bacteroidia bacterium]|nr:beta-N-acetylhexosaminidase [Bacteroidia bacterium]
MNSRPSSFHPAFLFRGKLRGEFSPARVLSFFIFTFLFLSSFAQYDEQRYPVIPRPYKLLPFSGDFTLDSRTVIVTDMKSTQAETDFFVQQLKDIYNINLKHAKKASKGNFIYVALDSSGVPPEGYQLFVNRNEIDLYGTKAGVFYGLQTLFQLIHVPAAVDRLVLPTIPSCSVIDQPQFRWRGLHLDVSRHFFTKLQVKEYLRWMAMYKLNTFHWHLTDDQGWRIEIKKYPRLTSIGAWRNGTLAGHEGAANSFIDTTEYGGFYTQNDIREIVRYADSLHITIVPEIEMPGHACAMLAAYPELGCTNGPFIVQPTWGVFNDVLCPSEKTFSFLDNVLTEVAALFPGKFIHIGGDECPKAEWKTNDTCQVIIRNYHLKDEDELQSWFTKRIVAMLQKKGKQAIGWDEILDGGLADGAAVMSWRGEEGGIAAAKAGHNVVMSPGGYCYFDHYQSDAPGEPLAIGGYLPLEKVYSYRPVPPQLSADESKYILGVQANMWTEYIGDEKKLQYMLFPRILALSEVAWSYTKENNYAFFLNRIDFHLNLFTRMNINCAKSIFDIKAKITSSMVNGVALSLEPGLMTGHIRYYIGDSDTGTFDHDYDFPVIIDTTVTIHAALFEENEAVTRTYVYHFDVSLATGKPVSLRKPPDKSYSTGGPFALVDGIRGEMPWKGSQWLGWWGDTLDAVIDLGQDTLINSVTFNFLVDSSSWIYPAQNYTIGLSEDGKTYVPLDKNAWIVTGSAGEFRNGGNVAGYARASSGSAKNQRARYIHLVVYPLGKIPPGNPGEGNPAWLFVSEINVN